MTALKTQRNDASVEDFLNRVPDARKREDCFALLALIGEVTGEEPAMWGTGIVGFGSYHYQYASGREGDWFLVGFSPRKQNLALYIMSGFEHYATLLAKLGRHKTGVSCLYLNRLEDVDLQVLRELIRQSVKHVRESNR